MWPREGNRSEAEQCGNAKKLKDGRDDKGLLDEVGRRGLEAVRGKYGEQELRRRFCDVLEGAAGLP